MVNGFWWQVFWLPVLHRLWSFNGRASCPIRFRTSAGLSIFHDVGENPHPPNSKKPFSGPMRIYKFCFSRNLQDFFESLVAIRWIRFYRRNSVQSVLVGGPIMQARKEVRPFCVYNSIPQKPMLEEVQLRVVSGFWTGRNSPIVLPYFSSMILFISYLGIVV